jgi:hypothetical protein
MAYSVSMATPSHLALRFPPRAVLMAWLVATLLSGAPSTLLAVLAGDDWLAATRAAGGMLIEGDSTFTALLAAAAVVHGAVSAFWAMLLAVLLPREHVAGWAIFAAALIAVLDLLVIAPAFFPGVAALAFGPQFADHLMWGACYGLTLAWLTPERGAAQQG